jgi:hypothetical protein
MGEPKPFMFGGLFGVCHKGREDGLNTKIFGQAAPFSDKLQSPKNGRTIHFMFGGRDGLHSSLKDVSSYYSVSSYKSAPASNTNRSPKNEGIE